MLSLNKARMSIGSEAGVREEAARKQQRRQCRHADAGRCPGMKHQRTLLHLVAIGLALVLSACATRPNARLAALNPAAQRAALEQCSEFELSGKIAVTQRTANGKDGGSGRFRWQQQGEVLRFELSAPLSQQTWRLEGLPGSYELTNSRGEMEQNASAEQLVWQASGWRLPIRQLPRWVRGLSSSESDAVEFTADGKLSSFVEQDWQVRYIEHTPDGLPRRIKANHPEASVVLLIKAWKGCR
jgi:outer membrane lipoprotein LolB